MQSFFMKPCKGGTAVAVNLKKEIKLDLNTIKNKFEKIVADTPVLLIVNYEGINVSIYPSGKLLIMECNSAEKIAREIYRLIL